MAWEQLEKMPDADVVCTDGRVGQLELLGVAPGTDEIDYLVVRRGFFFHRDILVPVEDIQDIEPDRDLIRLRISREQADQLEPYYHLPDVVTPVVETVTAPVRWLGQLMGIEKAEVEVEAELETKPCELKAELEVEAEVERPEGMSQVPPPHLFDPGARPHRINLNTATLSELESLRWIGRKTAEEIVAHRPYGSVEELAKVPGLETDVVMRLREALEV